MPKQKGGKLKASELKDFLSASYDKTPPNDLDGYILDKSLSTATAKVYYNPQTNHAVVAHRGTQGTLDWGNNIAYALGAYEYTSRYKQGKKTQDQAEKKYGKQNISTLGHSQGAILARNLGTNTKEVINVNPAYTNERPAKNEYNVRSSTDVVSGLYAPVAKTRKILFPKYSEKHDITIPSQSTTDILGEHSYNILDRLGDKEIGVGAGNKFSSNNIMYNEVKAGKRYSRLGYSGEDIDWIGGGVITTDNNCGAVGTPYVNKGTNPYGTRGAGRDSDSDSDDDWMEGGKIKNPFKKVGQAFDKVGKAFQPAGDALAKGAIYANPMMWALKDKDTSQAMAKTGEITHDYLLPAVVSAGKPIYDATAIVGSTMLTGNPVLGKAVADTLWNEMVAKPGNDPRQNQKSAELGELSETFGKAVSKPYSAALGGYRLKAGMEGVVQLPPPPPRKGKGRRKKGGASREQIGQASVMRTYGERGTDTYYLLSDIVHSADKFDKENSIFRDLMMRKDNEIAHILKEMEPSFFNQLYYWVLKSGKPQAEIDADLTRILTIAPMAKKGIPRGKRWGEDDPIVQQALAKIQNKRQALGLTD